MNRKQWRQAWRAARQVGRVIDACGLTPAPQDQPAASLWWRCQPHQPSQQTPASKLASPF